VVSPSVEPKQRRRGNTSGTIVAAALLFDVRTFFENAASPHATYLDTNAPVAHPGPNVTSARGRSRDEATFRPFRSSLYVTMMTVE